MKRNIPLIFYGLISALSFAPTYLIFLGIIGFGLFFERLLESQNRKQAFMVGFLFGFGHFIVGFYWISISLFVDIGRYFWLLPFSISLIPAAAALYIGTACWLFHFLKEKFAISGFGQVILMAICWLVIEIARSYLFLPFPWNLIGYIFAFDDNFIQIAAYIGIWGLSFLAIILLIGPYYLYKNYNKLTLSCLVVVFVGIYLFGYWRINHLSENLTDFKDFKLRLVQANIKQQDKWDDAYQYQSFRKNLDMAAKNNQGITHVILPETATPYAISDNNYRLLSEFKNAIPKNGSIVTGALRIDDDGNYFNSAFIINDNLEVSDFYDKHSLVPFGEYIPLAKIFPFLTIVTNGSSGFRAGAGPKTIKAQNGMKKFSPLICYEVIFPELIIDKNNRPDFLQNITNDAWFGKGAGPRQHLAQARMRAIEQGLPLARAANTGISAMIDPKGRVLASLPLNMAGFVDASLPKPLAPTFYSRTGDWPFALVLLLGLAATAFRARRRQQRFSD